MNSEKERLGEVFDNWYYDGLSVTNKRESLDKFYFVSMLNDYLKWARIFAVMLELGLDNIPAYRVLDAGCGNGNALRKMIEYGADPSLCYGIDISEKVIAFAKEISPAAVNFKQGYIDATGLEDSSLDIILNFGVLIHILDNDYIRKIGTEFHRMLKVGGVAFVIVSEEGAGWKDTIKEVTRNFDMANRELEGLFDKLECLGVMDLYSDKYPAEVSVGQIITAFEQNAVKGVPFKLMVFRKTRP